jgi:hypothetical protein
MFPFLNQTETDGHRREFLCPIATSRDLSHLEIKFTLSYSLTSDTLMGCLNVQILKRNNSGITSNQDQSKEEYFRETLLEYFF